MGCSDFGLADRLKIPREEAQRFIADYFTAYPGIRRYTVEIRILARDQGFVTTLLGRRRYLPELTARNGALRSAGERMAINMPIQGTAADGMKIAMVRMDAAIRERGLRSQMLLQVHDELVFETDEEELPVLAALADEVMEGALPLDPPLEVALKVGTDWETMDRYVREDEHVAARPEDGGRRGSRGGGRGDRRAALGVAGCRSCRRSRPSRATCSAGWRARRSPMPRCAGQRTIRHPEPEQFVAEIRGAQISRVGRRAKSVLIHLADGRVMTVALRMTGALIVAPPGTPDDPYARVVFQLADGRELRYRDVRKFGRIGLWEGGGLPRAAGKRARRGKRVGGRQGAVPGRRRVRPPRAGAAGHHLHRRQAGGAAAGRSARLKTLLLDQSFVAGVGNIYADEALWRARLHPLRTADSLTPDEVRAAASGHPLRPAPGHQQPGHQLRRLRRGR